MYNFTEMRLKKKRLFFKRVLETFIREGEERKFKRIYIQLFSFAHVHEISRRYLRKFQKKERKKWKSYR